MAEELISMYSSEFCFLADAVDIYIYLPTTTRQLTQSSSYMSHVTIQGISINPGTWDHIFVRADVSTRADSMRLIA